MSKSDTDSNSESYKSLSDDDFKSEMLTPRDVEETASIVDSSDETVDAETAKGTMGSTKEHKMKATDAVEVEAAINEIDFIEKELNEEKTENVKEANELGEKISTNAIGTENQTHAIKQNNTMENVESAAGVAVDVRPDTLTEQVIVAVDSVDNELIIPASNEKSDDNKILNNQNSTNRTKVSRGEKKARRLLLKQGAKPLPNISRLVMREGTVLFIIENAEIYKNPHSDTFIVFGEVKIEDFAKEQENLLTNKQIQAAQTIVEASKLHASKAVSINVDELDNEETIDETGIDPTDISLVMSQASTTRAKAVRALRANNNDIVNAIMDLTM